MSSLKPVKLKTALSLTLARELKELRDHTNSEHDRLHAEADKACEALQQRFKDRAVNLFRRIADAEGLPAEFDTNTYALDLSYFDECGDAYLKPLEPVTFPGFGFPEADPFGAFDIPTDKHRKH